MSGGLWSDREIVYGDSSASSVEGEPPLVLPASDSSDEGQEEILLNNEVSCSSCFSYFQTDPAEIEEALKVDPDDDFSATIEGNLAILKEHSTESQTRFFVPFDIRKIMHRGMFATFLSTDTPDELTTITFLEALYDPQVKFLLFPYIVDNSSSQYVFHFS